MSVKTTPKNGTLKFLKIVSGLSGSGKSIALRALEDIGFYCVDNLPVILLKEFADEVIESNEEPLTRAAVSIDSRNEKFLGELTNNVKHLKKRGIGFEIIYLEAEESVLVKRFSETRRKHPLMNETVSLLESIQLEKKLMNPVSERAIKHFDTTNMSPHELRNLIQEDAAMLAVGEPIVLFKSFAYKRGAPLDADFVFDVRCLPNPYWVPSLKNFNGMEKPIADYFEQKPEVKRMIHRIDSFISEWLADFQVAGRVYITVAIGCTGGRHRSVYVVERLVSRFIDRELKVQKRHSEFL